ncbi:MAG: helix-turn-helix domain-containing protein [Mucilaginibacter sp.]|uniref:winged helix-turn-helix transcriptional regulator n=1 Tax=Mucilaginibacter sp. TaxID=1882438 RepID=UPI0031A078A9
METVECPNELCFKKTMALRDALDLLGGKWKLCLIHNLNNYGTMRFKDLMTAIADISPKVLSKELQDLEENMMVKRTVNNTKPVTVSYTLTEHAKVTIPVINSLLDFGLKHRRKIIEK